MAGAVRWLILVVLMLAGCTSPAPAPSPPGLSTSGPSASATSTSVPAPGLPLTGDCVAPSDVGVSTYTAMRPIPCSRAHGYEVIAVVPLDGDAYPGKASLDGRATQECQFAFLNYVGRSSGQSLYTSRAVVPTAEDWGAPENRALVCLAGTDGTSLAGSLRGDARVLPRPGECFGPLRPDRLPLVDCAAAHNYEVYAELYIGEGTTPADLTVFCRRRFADFAGVPAGTTSFVLGELGPTAIETTRRAVCYAGSPDGGLVGSIRGTRR